MWDAVPLDHDDPGLDLGSFAPDPLGSALGPISAVLAHLDEPGGFLPDLDRDGDDRPDTACIDWRDGIALATDVDRDGRVDTVTTFDRTGGWRVYQRSEQDWEVGPSGRIE